MHTLPSSVFFCLISFLLFSCTRFVGYTLHGAEVDSARLQAHVHAMFSVHAAEACSSGQCKTTGTVHAMFSVHAAVACSSGQCKTTGTVHAMFSVHAAGALGIIYSMQIYQY